jgi:hypothetical protein
MMALTAVGVTPPPRPPVVAPEVDERAARRSLLDQIAKLESELSALFCATYPRTGFKWDVPSHGGPRLLGLADLEEIRDRLADRLSENRLLLSDRTYVESRNRRLIEEMMLEPAKHKWMRIGNEDIGEPGCKYWEVRPRLGIIGMMMGWWRVKISSGCPLDRPRGRWAAAADGQALAQATRSRPGAGDARRARRAPPRGRSHPDSRPPR